MPGRDGEEPGRVIRASGGRRSGSVSGSSLEGERWLAAGNGAPEDGEAARRRSIEPREHGRREPVEKGEEGRLGGPVGASGGSKGRSHCCLSGPCCARRGARRDGSESKVGEVTASRLRGGQRVVSERDALGVGRPAAACRSRRKRRSRARGLLLFRRASPSERRRHGFAGKERADERSTDL